MARASRRLPTSARPKVSSRPVESAIANDDQRRLAVRTKREPSVLPSAERGHPRRFYDRGGAECGRPEGAGRA